MELETVKELIGYKLSDLERKMLGLPDLMQRELDRTSHPSYRKTFAHLRDSSYAYLTTPANDNVQPDIQWVDFSFATDYEPARKALRELRNNLFNDSAKRKLEEKLREGGAFGKEKKEFYFWNTDPAYWSDISYQSRSAKLKDYPLRAAFGIVSFPPQYMALGDFTINAIPEGYVQPLSNEEYEICVKKIYFFINDTFNFEGDEFLSWWDLVYKGQDFSNALPLTPLHNRNFSDFTAHGYGKNIPVRSRLKEMDNFWTGCWKYTHAK